MPVRAFKQLRAVTLAQKLVEDDPRLVVGSERSHDHVAVYWGDVAVNPPDATSNLDDVVGDIGVDQLLKEHELTI